MTCQLKFFSTEKYLEKVMVKGEGGDGEDLAGSSSKWPGKMS